MIYFLPLVIAMGPWSKNVYKYFPKCKNLSKLHGAKANSIVIKTNKLLPNQIPSCGYFIQHENYNGIHMQARSNGTIYAVIMGNSNLKMVQDPLKLPCASAHLILAKNIEKVQDFNLLFLYGDTDPT